MSRALERLWYTEQERWPRRLMLAPLAWVAWVYGVWMRLRRALYARGLLRVHRVPGVRVISVGNLNVGGTGKTPAVIALAQRLKPRAKVAVVTRGYGRSGRDPVALVPSGHHDAREAGDEPVLIAERTQVPVLVDADRVRATRRAKDEFGVDIVLLDDGMQHLRLARDLDVVVVDEAVGFGNRRLLPRGPLREPLGVLSRAGMVWLREAPRPVPVPAVSAPVVRVRYAPSGWVRPDGGLEPLEALQGRRVVALCGIARPSSFERTLSALTLSPLRTFAFPDHHPFTAAELDQVVAFARTAGAQVVTTEKDRARLPAGWDAWALRLAVQVTQGEAHLDRLLLG